MQIVKYHLNLSNYFQSQILFFDGDRQKKSNIRKCMEQPWQQTKAEMWDEVTDTLCNLDFIQAKAVAKLTYELVRDLNAVLEVIPDNAENIRQEKARQERMEKYTRDLIACAKGEITRFELEVPESVTPCSQETIDIEIKRIKSSSDRLDRLKDFTNFLGHEAGNLQNYAQEFPHFASQQAWNYSGEGPVGDVATCTSPVHLLRLMLRITGTRPSWNPLPQMLQNLKGHSDRVDAVAITPDGSRAISGSEDNTCILWDLNTGQEIKILKGHTNRVSSVAITPDCKRAISGSYDKICISWDLNTGQAISKMKGHSDWIRSVAVTPDGKRAISGSGGCYDSVDNNCVIWDVETGKVLCILKGHTSKVNAVDISSDGKIAISCSSDKTCIIWDTDTGKALRTLKGHYGEVTSVAVTPDGTRVITGSSDKTCKIWDVNTGEIVNSLMEHSYNINGIDLTADGKMAISCSGDNFSGYDDNNCIFWNLITGKVIKILKGHTDKITAVSITPDGKRAISASLDFACIIWDLMTGLEIQTRKGHFHAVKDVAVTSDGKRAVSGSDDHTCIIWDLCTGHPIRTLKGHAHKNIYGDSYYSILAVAITPDNNRAISGSLDKTCIIWDMNTGQAVKTLEGHTSNVNVLEVTADGRRVISGSDDKNCIVWNLNSGSMVKTMNDQFSVIHAVTITPDGRRIITDSWDDTCIIRDMNTGQIINTLKGHKSTITVVSVSPDGRRAITGSADKTCILWDLKTGKAINFYRGHTHKVTDIIFTPDGTKVISSSYDGTCIIWDVKSTETLGLFIATSAINAISYFPGGLFGGEKSGKIFIIDLKKEFLLSAISITNVRRLWDFKWHRYHKPSSDCPLCGHRFAPPASVLATIEEITQKAGLTTGQSPCLELPHEAWEHPGLLGECPNCKEKLKFNPFIAGGEPDLKQKPKWKFW